MKFKFLLSIPFLLLARGLVLFAANVPIGDDYDAILNYLNHPWPERFFHLADFHNEHRIIPTRLVSELVYRALGHIDFRAVIWIGNIGWWLFAGLFAWLFGRRGGMCRWGSVFACWMLVGFYDQENAFCSMTTVQNHWVIVFAFAACLAFSRRTSWKWFAASLTFAVAATFTSGGGLLVFPALALTALCDWLFGARLGQSRQDRMKSVVGVLIFVLVATVACGLMLHNLPHNNDPSIVFPDDPVQRIRNSLAFFFCFFGNMLLFVPPAVLMGLVLVLWGLAITRYLPRFRGTSLALFAFLAFLVAQILAAAAFRGANAALALPGRYRLIPAAIIVSLLYLTLVEVPIATRLKKGLLMLALVGCFLFSAAYTARGVIYNAAHRTQLETGMAQWPTSDAGLDYPTNACARLHASAILRKSTQCGVYAPPCVKP